MQNFPVFLSPHQKIQSFVGFLKYFRSEIIKVIIFLFIFFASIFYANQQSKEYYGMNKDENESIFSN
jgi:hypothetical protein